MSAQYILVSYIESL